MAYQHYRSPFGDTTYTKVFVGGLAWETPTDVMRLYFEQFGEILEAVIITDKNTGKSKGYGFVTFRDPDSATRACTDPNPVIDGRRANCNIASLGRPRPSPPRGRNQGVGNMAYQAGLAAQGGGLPLPLPPPAAAAAQPTPPVMYQPYGYATYPPEYVYPQAYYNPQFQQAQYYNQMYGGGGGGHGGSSSTNMGMGSPYFYGYSMQANTRGAAAYSAVVPQAQRIQAPSYLYYPTHQVDTGSSFPTFSPTSYQTPPQHLLPFQPARNVLLSPPASDSPAAAQHTPSEADHSTIASESLNT